MNFRQHLVITGAILLFVLFAMPIEKESDFYDFHVWECKQCHSERKSFSVCSGFCFEPDDKDLRNLCVVHITEQCETNIEHGSVLGQTYTVFGVVGYMRSK